MKSLKTTLVLHCFLFFVPEPHDEVKIWTNLDLDEAQVFEYPSAPCAKWVNMKRDKDRRYIPRK